ncbi:MAG: hypothetical protein IT364_07275 [Candidatus Hydrogenedentes bacterium]|nr:hypothetical protein [Candidatus Hydrogenedentota bacterium]
MNDLLTILQKTGVWIWNQKEKMVLFALMLVLLFRAVLVVKGTTLELEDKVKANPPKPPEEVVMPPDKPAPPRQADFQGLVQRNPFSITGISSETQTDDSAPERLPLELERIVPWSDGTVRAVIRSKDARGRRYAEGEAFEDYRIVSIDDATKTVVVYSSTYDRNFTLTAQGAG